MFSAPDEFIIVQLFRCHRLQSSVCQFASGRTGGGRLSLVKLFTNAKIDMYDFNENLELYVYFGALETS